MALCRKFSLTYTLFPLVYHHQEIREATLQVSEHLLLGKRTAAAAAAKSLQSCSTLCDPIDGSPPGSAVPGILQARTLEWVAISFSNAWKWKVKVKSLSRVRVLLTHGLQPTRLLRPWDFPGKSTGVGCHRLLQERGLEAVNVSLEIREHLPKFTAHPIQDCRANFVIRH